MPTDDDASVRSTRGDDATTRGAIEDAFDKCLALESTARDAGYDEGVDAGRAIGEAEGRELGFRKGFELAEEVGYYAGCASAWKACARASGTYGERVERMIETLERECRESKLGDPLDEGILERVERLRGRFKTLVALLGARAVYADADASGLPSF